MSYSTIEARVQTLIRGIEDFDFDDVVRGDYRVLERGHPPYVVLTQGSFTRSPAGTQRRATDWTVIIEVIETSTGNGTDYTNLQANCQAVIDEMDKWLLLNSLTGVVETLLESGDRPTVPMDLSGSGPHFLSQEMRLRVTEKVDITGGDYS